MPEFQAGRNPASHAPLARGGFARIRAKGLSSPQQRDEPQRYHQHESGNDGAENLLALGPIRELAGEKPTERLAEDEGRDQQDDDDMGQVEAQPFSSMAGASTGAPAFFQAPKPPATWATGFSPISCATLAASAERQPPPQKKTKRLSCWKTGLA